MWVRKGTLQENSKAVVELSLGIKEQNPLGRFSDKPKVIKYKWKRMDNF